LAEHGAVNSGVPGSSPGGGVERLYLSYMLYYFQTQIMRSETRTAMEKLFTCEWKLTDAAEYCNLTIKEIKIIFNEYCNFHPPTYDVGNGNQLNLF
jgi:hypothetical protein